MFELWNPIRKALRGGAALQTGAYIPGTRSQKTTFKVIFLANTYMEINGTNVLGYQFALWCKKRSRVRRFIDYIDK